MRTRALQNEDRTSGQDWWEAEIDAVSDWEDQEERRRRFILEALNEIGLVAEAASVAMKLKRFGVEACDACKIAALVGKFTPDFIVDNFIIEEDRIDPDYVVDLFPEESTESDEKEDPDTVLLQIKLGIL